MGGKLLRYNNFSVIPPRTLRYGSDRIAPPYGSYADFNGGQWCYNLKKIFNQNSVYYGLRNDNYGDKIVNENEAFVLSSLKTMIGGIILGTDFASSIANYIRKKYTNGNTMPNFTYDDAIYSLEQNTASSGSQSSIDFYVSYRGMVDAHNGSILNDIWDYGWANATYDDWMFDIYPYISDAVDWEYSMSSPAVSSTYAEALAATYVDNSVYPSKTYKKYRNISIWLHPDNNNISVPEIDSILILAPLYVTSISLRTDCGISGDTHYLNPIFRFNFCNVFLITYEDLVGASYSSSQDIEIGEYKINITVQRRNGGYISGTNRNILINNYWL